VVIVNDFYQERAKATAAEIDLLGAQGVPVAADVSDFEAVKNMVSTAEAQAGPIDILVNNAGNAGPTESIHDSTPFWLTQPTDWQPWLSANLYGVLNCTHAVVGGMVDRGFGRVVAVVSDAGRVGEPNLVVYSAAKAGAAGFIRALAKATGHAGVTANCVALSAMNTPATQALTADPRLLDRVLKRYPIPRLGEPADAANLVLFLVSDAASWITGQTYPVNGGYSLAL